MLCLIPSGNRVWVLFDELELSVKSQKANQRDIELVRDLILAIEKLNDDELEAVIAHELTHIRNRDVRLLVVSIVFVGIFSMIATIIFSGLRRSSLNSRNKNDNMALVLPNSLKSEMAVSGMRICV